MTATETQVKEPSSAAQIIDLASPSLRFRLSDSSEKESFADSEEWED